MKTTATELKVLRSIMATGYAPHRSHRSVRVSLFGKGLIEIAPGIKSGLYKATAAGVDVVGEAILANRAANRGVCCTDCGQEGERKGHMGCQYPQD